MRPNPSSRFVRAIVMSCAALLLSACATQDIEFIETPEDYDTARLEALLEATTSPELEKRTVEDAPELRREALSELRSQSTAGSRAADLITRTFPDVSAVPFHVQTAKFEGADAVLLIEAVAGTGGSLSARRLWAIDDQGDILLSLMR